MSSPKILVQIDRQILVLTDHLQSIEYPVSTALNGVGQENGSGCTPLGKHIVRAKIGDGVALDSVFVGRRATGECYSERLAQQYPSRDWILTRILWLSGMQPGYNRLGSVDSMRRYIYIHGTPDTEPMGVPKSHGCIRMRNKDIVDLFDRVQTGCEVDIVSSTNS